MTESEVPLSSSESFGREVLNKRPELEDYYSARDRRGSWDTGYETDTDEFIPSPKEELPDMIKLYNYLQSQRDSGRHTLHYFHRKSVCFCSCDISQMYLIMFVINHKSTEYHLSRLLIEKPHYLLQFMWHKM